MNNVQQLLGKQYQSLWRKLGIQTSHRTAWQRIKDRRWVWRPILLFAVIGFIIYVVISESAYTTMQLNILRGSDPITKVKMNVYSTVGTNRFLITDRAQLDSIDHALKQAKEKNIQKGGAFEITADIHMCKGKDSIDFAIRYSIYNGWMIDVGNKTLTNEYLFTLVKRCAKK